MIVSISLGLGVLAILAYLGFAGAVLRGAEATRVQRLSLVLAWLLHGLAWGMGLFGSAELRFGFAPALSMTAWLVLTVYMVEQSVFPKIRARWTLGVLAAAMVGAAAAFPGKVQPAQGGILALHWALGLAAYGMFGAAVVHAWLMREAEGGMRNNTGHAQGVPLLGLERLMFRFIGIGFALLSATLLAGTWMSVAAQPTHTWRWDHKTVFSLMAWGVFAALLAGRLWAGWRGQRATRMVITGSVLLLLAYAGSRFVLEVVLKR
jgi:ABC-type uncharacterized transport system permease subunit